MKRPIFLVLLLIISSILFTFCKTEGTVYDYDDEITGDDTGDFSKPYGVFIFPDVYAGGGAQSKGSSGSVFITDTFNHKISVFDLLDSSFRYSYGTEGTADGQFNQPRVVAINKNITPNLKGSSGSVFITDTFNNRIQVFDLNGNFIRKFGTEGTADGQFDKPTAVSVIPYTYKQLRGSSGSVFITDTFNNRIQVFDFNGNFIRKFGNTGTEVQKLNKPHGIFVATVDVLPQLLSKGSSGSVFITDTFNNRIAVFDTEGTFVTEIGKDLPEDARFSEPEGVTVDLMGNIYVADTGNDRVVMLDKDGEYVGKIGETGSEQGKFNKPTSVSVDSSGTLFVADSENNRVQTFKNDAPTIQGFDIEFSGNINAGLPVTITVTAIDQNGEVLKEFDTTADMVSSNGIIGMDKNSISINDGVGTESVTFTNAGTTKVLIPYGYLLSESAEITVGSPRVYVSTTGDDANAGTQAEPKLTIQAGINYIADQSQPGEVFIAGGTYEISADITLADEVSLLGGFNTSWEQDIANNPTIITDTRTAGGTEFTPIAVLKADSTISVNTLIDGLTINGSTLSGTEYASGVYIEQGAVTITRSEINGGTGDGSYGVFINGTTTAPIIRNSKIDGGQGAAAYGVYILESEANIYNNIIIGSDTLTTGTRGIYVEGSSPIIRNNTIDGGSSSGVSYAIELITGTLDSAPIIENNIIFITAGTTKFGIFSNNPANLPASLRNNDIAETNVFWDGTTSYDNTNINDPAYSSGNITDDPALDADFVPTTASVTTGGIDGTTAYEDWGFDIDKNGTTRTGNGLTGWSIGAYEVD